MEMPKNNIEGNIKREKLSGFDFARSLKQKEILGAIGEDIYKTNLRTDAAEIISNLSRMLDMGDLRRRSWEELETQVDAALSGERASITKINLSNEQTQKIKIFILERLREFIG